MPMIKYTARADVHSATERVASVRAVEPTVEPNYLLDDDIVR
jgi:hypothetical protein